MHAPTPFAALVVLFAAAGTSAWHCWTRAVAFDAAAVGLDPASLERRRLAPLRDDLAARGTTHVGVAFDEGELGAGHLAIVDVFAAALHRYLTTGACDPPPGFDDGYIAMVAAGFRDSFPPEQNRDLASVRANLIEWWTKLAGGMRAGLSRSGLAPLVIRPAGTTWVVGDFTLAFDYRALAARRRLVVVKDYGEGIVLFRQEP